MADRLALANLAGSDSKAVIGELPVGHLGRRDHLCVQRRRHHLAVVQAVVPLGEILD
jgi:hypothetical protein